jgi:hypothetical protein
MAPSDTRSLLYTRKTKRPSALCSSVQLCGLNSIPVHVMDEAKRNNHRDIHSRPASELAGTRLNLPEAKTKVAPCVMPREGVSSSFRAELAGTGTAGGTKNTTIKTVHAL